MIAPVPPLTSADVIVQRHHVAMAVDALYQHAGQQPTPETRNGSIDLMWEVLRRTTTQPTVDGLLGGLVRATSGCLTFGGRAWCIDRHHDQPHVLLVQEDDGGRLTGPRFAFRVQFEDVTS